jgi:hypothetical protein
MAGSALFPWVRVPGVRCAGRGSSCRDEADSSSAMERECLVVLGPIIDQGGSWSVSELLVTRPQSVTSTKISRPRFSERLRTQIGMAMTLNLCLVRLNCTCQSPVGPFMKRIGKRGSSFALMCVTTRKPLYRSTSSFERNWRNPMKDFLRECSSFERDLNLS